MCNIFFTLLPLSTSLMPNFGAYYLTIGALATELSQIVITQLTVLQLQLHKLESFKLVQISECSVMEFFSLTGDEGLCRPFG